MSVGLCAEVIVQHHDKLKNFILNKQLSFLKKIKIPRSIKHSNTYNIFKNSVEIMLYNFIIYPCFTF